MEIKELNRSDLPQALALVENVFDTFNAPDYSADGIRHFKEFIKQESITVQMESAGMRLFGVFEGGALACILALARKNHVSLLFTKPAYHRKGFAHALIAHAAHICKADGQTHLSVNADLYAVQAYRKMGFTDTSAVQERDGIRFVPMTYNLST